jgi:heme-degrading monooxygenase HmoA
MWAQLIKMRVKSGREDDASKVAEQLRAAEQPDSGLIRTIGMHDQNDPNQYYTLVIFESEEKARLREKDPRRAEAMTGIRANMADIFEGPPEFVDLVVDGNV